MKTLNLGILAHVDAGKTSLTERLLYAAGVIDDIGRVDDGNTQTDSLALERQRGITIKSAVVSFVLDDVTVNLIDTPGHPDFIAEVERVLSTLDGAVLVVSAVEGVQAQTRILLRTLRRLRIPTLIFVNKIDRPGAQHQSLLTAIRDKLHPAIVAMGAPRESGSRAAEVVSFAAESDGFTSELLDVLAGQDDALLTAYVSDPATLSYERLRGQLARQTAQALVHPVFFGSAMTGAGVTTLMSAITELLPATAGDPDADVSGSVFKVARGSDGEKIAYVRMFAGTVRTRDRIALSDGRQQKVTAIGVFERGAVVAGPAVSAGRIAQLWGLHDIQIGDQIGTTQGSTTAHSFAPPTLETVVVPVRAADRGALHVALTQLAEQDPLIDMRRAETEQDIAISLYGEVQKEVIQSTLVDEYGLDVEFRETTTICIERLNGAGSAHELIGVAPNPFLATVGLRVQPAPIGAGMTFRLAVELGSMPSAFFTAVRETVAQVLQAGVHGWEVPDCLVTYTHSGYWARQSHAHGTFDKSMSSTAGNFRQLTPLVLMAALTDAGTTVHEPLHAFSLEVPADTLGPLLPALARLGAIPEPPAMRGTVGLLEGEIPAAQIHSLQQLLPGLTHGEGVLESAFQRYAAVPGRIPERPVTGPDPRRRKDYLRDCLTTQRGRGPGPGETRLPPSGADATAGPR